MTDRKRRVARIFTWVYFLSTVSALFLWLDNRFFGFSVRNGILEYIFFIANIPVGASLLSIVVLALITLALIRRKRIVLFVIGIWQILGILATLAELVFFSEEYVSSHQYFDLFFVWLSLIVGITIVATLIWLTPVFPAKSHSGSWIGAITTALVGLLITCAALTVLLLCARIDHGALWQQLVTALAHGAAWGAALPWKIIIAPFIIKVASLLLGTTAVATVVAFLRSPRQTDTWNPGNELLARTMLAQFGEDDSLGYVATRRDKLLHFSADKKAAIAYQIFGNVALASGDPIGNPDSWGEAILAWERYVRSYGWTPGMVACSERGARAMSDLLGYSVIRLGDESILTPERFGLDTAAMTDVRKAVRRVRREGYVCTVNTQGELSEDELAEIIRDADAWRHGTVERGFSMALGRFADPADPRIVVARVTDPDGTLVALMTFLPWGRSGLSLDLMRRSLAAPNGVNEFLIAELMAWCTKNAVRRVSLNFAFLRHIFAEAEQVSATPVSKASSRILGALDSFWQLRRLYRANAKYRPTWVPRYVVLPSMINVFSVAKAYMAAEGFIPHITWSKTVPTETLQLDDETLALVKALDAPPAPRRWITTASQQQRQRAEHGDTLAGLGRAPHPVGRRSATALAAIDIDKLLAGDEVVNVAGRIRTIRDHGSVCFADLVDAHAKVQLVFDAHTLGDQQVSDFAKLIDSADIVEVVAHPGSSRNGTRSLIVERWTLLAKSYAPIPWEGLSDPQTRLRHRSMDLLVHPEKIDLLHARSRAIGQVRATLCDHAYTEVETPILQTIHGGATARPFRTYINAYSADLVLRIAPELALKRLVVGGMGAVFEIGRNFRNEGADATHNPEFTVVEAYSPFADYNDMRLLTQQIIQRAAHAVHGRTVMPLPNETGESVLTDISGTWPVVDVCTAVSEAVGQPVNVDTDIDVLMGIAHDHGVEVRPDRSAGGVIEQLYGELVEPRTIHPTFYVDFPAETSPLTAPHRSKPGLVERWDLVAAGMELGTAYSELTDPMEQRRRLVEQSWKAANGDAEAMEVDEEFLAALELGMPPCGGLGIGLDRLVMALTGTTIRDVLSFPFVKPAR